MPVEYMPGTVRDKIYTKSKSKTIKKTDIAKLDV